MNAHQLAEQLIAELAAYKKPDSRRRRARDTLYVLGAVREGEGGWYTVRGKSITKEHTGFPDGGRNVCGINSVDVFKTLVRLSADEGFMSNWMMEHAEEIRYYKDSSWVKRIFLIALMARLDLNAGNAVPMEWIATESTPHPNVYHGRQQLASSVVLNAPGL